MNLNYVQSILVIDFLQTSVELYADRTALIFGDCRLSYAEINNAANCFANALSRSGFQRGDRCLIVLENSPAVVIAIFGILKLGGIFSVLHPETKTDRLAYIANNCQAKALISDCSHIETIALARKRAVCLQDIWLCRDKKNEVDVIPHTFRSFEGDLTQVNATNVFSPCIDLDLAALIYTSGSTGKPKGVMMTHRNIVSAVTSINHYLKNTSDDIILDVLPLSFDYGLYQVFLAFQVGASIVLERSFTYPHSVIGRMIKERVTALPGVPTLFAMLFQLNLQQYDFSTVRYITNTGAPLPPVFSLRLKSTFPNARIFSMYGLTECKRVSYLPPEQLSKRPTSVGKAMPNVEIFIVDEAGKLLPANKEGELVVRGSNVMQGYWGDPAGTADVLRPGLLPGERVLYTGDLFRMDDEGYLYFVCRRDDIIKSKGERISPREIEDVLYALPGVLETKVVGVPDEILGMAIKASITRSNDMTISEQDVINHCKKYLESFKVPHQVEFVSALPRTPSGKIKMSK